MVNYYYYFINYLKNKNKKGLRYAIFSTALGSVTMFLSYEKALEYFNKRYTKV